MDRITNINIDRIYWCCNDQHSSIDELVTLLGINPDVFASFLEGERGLTFNQLKKIADYFGRGILFFLEEGEIDGNTLHSPQFRTITNQKPHLSRELRSYIERVEYQRDIFLSLIEDDDDGFLGQLQSFELEFSTPSEAAAAARIWLNVANINSFDTYRSAIEKKGVLIFRSNGYVGNWKIPNNSEILGFSLYDESCPVIVVRKQEFETRQAFTLAHELGHLLMHKSSFIDELSDFDSFDLGQYEIEANSFAGHFLVPTEYLSEISLDIFDADISTLEQSLKPFRNKWCASYEVIIRRFIEEGLLPRQILFEYRDWRDVQPKLVSDSGGNRQYRHREPKHIFGDRYVRTVLSSLSEKKITLAKASDYLDRIKVADIHQLEGFYENV